MDRNTVHDERCADSTHSHKPGGPSEEDDGRVLATIKRINGVDSLLLQTAQQLRSDRLRHSKLIALVEDGTRLVQVLRLEISLSSPMEAIRRAGLDLRDRLAYIEVLVLKARTRSATRQAIHLARGHAEMLLHELRTVYVGERGTQASQ